MKVEIFYIFVKESKRAIQVVKYSPNGEKLAIGGIDGNNKRTVHIFYIMLKINIA